MKLKASVYFVHFIGFINGQCHVMVGTLFYNALYRIELKATERYINHSSGYGLRKGVVKGITTQDIADAQYGKMVKNIDKSKIKCT